MPRPPIPPEDVWPLVRRLIDEGELPVVQLEAIGAGYGSSHSCPICLEDISESQVEYEVSPCEGLRFFHMHCFAVWQLECERRLHPSPNGHHAAGEVESASG